MADIGRRLSLQRNPGSPRLRLCGNVTQVTVTYSTVTEMVTRSSVRLLRSGRFSVLSLSDVLGGPRVACAVYDEVCMLHL